MKKILLTGCHGFVASRFYCYYKDRYDFILLHRNNIDITDEEKVYRLFKDENIDIVFHAAAMADIDECQKNPEAAHKTNVQATINIAKGCLLKNSILVFTGSDQIYSANTEGGPYSEDTVPIPGNFYASTKLEAEKEISKLMERYYNLRLTWMFSMPEKDKRINKGIVCNILKALDDNSTAYLNSNDFRGLTYVYEVIENFKKIIELPYGNYNAGSENDLSVYEIGRIILKNLNMSHREDEILCRIFGEKSDLRISNKKLKECGVLFSDTEQAVSKCISS